MWQEETERRSSQRDGREVGVVAGRCREEEQSERRKRMTRSSCGMKRQRGKAVR